MNNIIVAVDMKFGIGYQNKLLCHIPTDLKRFKQLTMGKTVVMGRKTFESLPNNLPGRNIIVITRNTSYKPKVLSANVKISNDLESVLSLPFEKFIAGGEEIYRIAMPYSDKIYLTLIKHEFIADTFFPHIDETVFVNKKVSPIQHDTFDFQFITYSRICD